MPEGDTVYRTARTLRRALAGVRLTGAELRVPRLATVDLSGGTVRDCLSRGKHLLLRLRLPTEAADDPDWTLHSHLGMDGAWKVYRVGQRWRGQPGHTVRAVLRGDQVVAVGSQLRQLALVPTARESDLVGSLGPDLLGDDWAPAEAVRRLAAQPDRSISEALLDQRNLAGIGNVYRCELLFLRGVAPSTPVREVPDLAGMVALAHRLVRANRDRGTRSTTGSLCPGSTSYVYARAGAPCRRCGTAIARDDHRTDRVSYWCPRCQPEARSWSSEGTP